MPMVPLLKEKESVPVIRKAAADKIIKIPDNSLRIFEPEF